jgi:hypothetical protein
VNYVSALTRFRLEISENLKTSSFCEVLLKLEKGKGGVFKLLTALKKLPEFT